MKKRLLIALMILTSCSSLFANKIDEQTARTAAYNFWCMQASTAHIQVQDLHLTYAAADKKNASTICYYIFNASASGFVIISADDNVAPVLGYSTEGPFKTDSIPANIFYWMDAFRENISYSITHKIPATETISAKWNKLRYPSVSKAAQATANVVVAPLIHTKWNQSYYYNNLCPYDVAQSSGTYTGCVATVMAQVMKYWSYPTTGTGTHSYTPATNPQYGVQTANFGATTYQWAQMPDVVTANNVPLQTIMYHAGVSVDMNYGVNESGAYVITATSPITNCTEYAMPAYFGYKTSLQGLLRSNYATTEWLAMMKMELNASRPIIYDGTGGAGGHGWVADGYDDNNFLHVNWGWSGSNDGYYSIDNLAPPLYSPNNFNADQEALIGIEPAHPTVALNLNDTLKAPGTLYLGQPFRVTAKIINNGTATFNGDYGVRIFDLNGNAIDSVQVLTNATLNAGNSTPILNFTTNGLASMVPGNYKIGIYYRPTGATWFEIGATALYSNLIPVTVEAVLSPDQYEGDNTQAQAAELPLSFVSNIANPVTAGTNFHLVTDNDFYKIQLADGYFYTITARLYDVNSPANPQAYTVNAALSYTVDANAWSQGYDYMMPSTLGIGGQHTVYFNVHPQDTLTMGTYVLDITVNRSGLNVQGINSNEGLALYPNPANDMLHINLPASMEAVNICITDLQGRSIETIVAEPGQHSFSIPIEAISDGLYFVQIHSATGIQTRKVLIKR